MVAALAAPGGSIAQDAKLVDAAKKEGGKVVVYGSIENDTMDLISAAFKKKTGLDVDFWRSASTKVMDRVLGESRSGKPLYDVVLTITPPMEFMFKEGALGKYDSPAAKCVSQRRNPSKPGSTIPQQHYRGHLSLRDYQTRRSAKVS